MFLLTFLGSVHVVVIQTNASVPSPFKRIISLNTERPVWELIQVKRGRIYIQRLEEFKKCTLHGNFLPQRAPVTERYSRFAWIFEGLNILHSKDTAFYRIKLHIMLITYQDRFTSPSYFVPSGRYNLIQL